MKIVHEFYGKSPCCGGGGDAYSSGRDRPKWIGFQVDLIVCDTDGKGDDGDSMYIEGDGKSVKLMLESLLSAVNLAEKFCRKKVRDRRKRSLLCSVCNGWYDTRSESHGDGKGKRCEGG